MTKSNVSQIELITKTILEQALTKAIAKRDRLKTNLESTMELVKQLEAAIAAD